MVEEIASSSWDSILAENSRPVVMETLPIPQVRSTKALPRKRRRDVDISLQAHHEPRMDYVRLDFSEPRVARPSPEAILDDSIAALELSGYLGEEPISVPSRPDDDQLPDLAQALAEIEKSLSRHLGPLAGVLIRNSRATTTNFEEFFESLAVQIPDEDEQKAFLKKVASLKPVRKPAPPSAPEPPPPPTARPEATGARGPATPFTPELLAAAEKRLASYVGPLARLLIKDAASKSGTIRDLYTQLAAHIDEEDERRTFLASLPRM